MNTIEVDEKKLDALLENSLISHHGLYRDSTGTGCNNGYIETPYGEVKICEWCLFRNKETIKEWLRKEE